jgi:hypothetical protein
MKKGTHFQHTEESKEKIRQSMLGIKKSPESIYKGVAKRRGQKRTEVQKRIASEIRMGKKRGAMSEETKIKIGNANRGRSPRKGYHHSEETKAKIGRANTGKLSLRKGTKLPLEHVMNVAKALRGKSIPPSVREKISITVKKLWADPNYGGNSRKRSIKVSEAAKKMWADPEQAKKIGIAQKISPNKPETIILNLLNEIYPNEWKYTGDFSFTIDGKSPDFTNINGQKKLIELFGDYWHKGENPQDRIDIFTPFGFSTLVIWEKELKDIKTVTTKIMDFSEGVTCTT